MPWYKVTLSQDDVIAWKHMQLQEAFEAIFLAHRAPKDAAMFDNYGGPGNFFFFSPGAARIAADLIARYAGVECPAPKAAAVSLLVGNSDAIDFLLGGKE